MDIFTLVLAKKMIEDLQFKTINGENILGEGNIEIIGGGTGVCDEATEEDIIELLGAYDIVKLLCDSTGYAYLDQDQKILVI